MRHGTYTDEELLQQLEECENRHGKVTTRLVNGDPDFAAASTFKSHFGTFSRAKQAACLDDVGQIHLTDDEYCRLDKRIRGDERLKDICLGLLMGDANLNEDPGKKGAALNLEMTNRPFLNWVSDEMGDICSNLCLKAEAEELASKNKKYGYTVNEKNYNDIYALRTRRLQYFDYLRSEWYKSGEKTFPDSLSLSPLLTKVWYCCDGSLVKPGLDAVYPIIYCHNERSRPDYLEALFDGVEIQPRFNRSGGGALQFQRSETEEFFNWIGDPLPGFHYKWPDSY